MNNTTGIEFGDILNILSVYLGMENLDLNMKQSKTLMRELRENQNSMLATIIKQNEVIIKLLREGKDAQRTD